MAAVYSFFRAPASFFNMKLVAKKIQICEYNVNGVPGTSELITKWQKGTNVVCLRETHADGNIPDAYFEDLKKLNLYRLERSETGTQKKGGEVAVLVEKRMPSVHAPEIQVEGLKLKWAARFLNVLYVGVVYAPTV